MSIKHAFALLIILSNTLFSSVWASAHLVADHHDSLESPHMHVISDIKTLLDFGKDINPTEHEEAEETHLHILTFLTTEYPHSASIKHSEHIRCELICYRNQTYSPPIPPPTA